MTGFSNTVKLAIRLRAGNGDPHAACCEACGRWLGNGGQLQHRVARRMGGTRKAVLNSPANGVLLCGTPQHGCHGKCEARDEHMHAQGFWLKSWQDPVAEPIMLSGYGSGVTVWLTEDGGYSSAAPGERVA